jgi:hypothetical protein
MCSSLWTTKQSKSKDWSSSHHSSPASPVHDSSHVQRYANEPQPLPYRDVPINTRTRLWLYLGLQTLIIVVLNNSVADGTLAYETPTTSNSHDDYRANGITVSSVVPGWIELLEVSD